jgi:hypothetical protein
MTDILQVMDLITNGPVKSGIRRERCDALFEYFASWKQARLQAQLDKKPPPKFQPPKPKVVDGLRILRKVCASTFQTAKYQQSMKECFVAVGLAPSHFKGYDFDGKRVDLEFVTYRNHRRGSMPIKKDPHGTDENSCLGEVAAELQMIQRGGVDSDDEGDGAASEEEEGGEEEGGEDEED